MRNSPGVLAGSSSVVSGPPPTLATLAPIFKIPWGNNVASVAGTSAVVPITTTAAIAAGDTLILTVSRDNASTDTNPPTDTLTDDKGNTWVLREGGIFAGTGSQRAFGIQFHCSAASAMASGTVITFTWTFMAGASITSKVGVLHAYSGSSTFVKATKVETLISTSPTLSIGLAALGNLVVAQMSWEEPSSAPLVPTADGDSSSGISWSAQVSTQSTTSGAGNDIGHATQSKIPVIFPTSPIYNPTLSAAADTVLIIGEYAPA